MNVPASRAAQAGARIALGAARIAGAGIALCLALVASLCLGSASLSPREVLAAIGNRLLGAVVPSDPVAVAIVWELRLARTLLAGTAGAALGAAGAVLQGLFRNPLADPYMLGVSSGASLGAVAAIVLGVASPIAMFGATEFMAFFGAIGAAVLVYSVANAGRRLAPVTSLLLAGAAVGSFISSIVSLIVSLDQRDLGRVFFWMLGGFGGKSWKDLATAVPPALAALVLAMILARPLDILGAGEEAATSLGLDVRGTRRLAVISSSLGAAAAVSAGGIIGFVGLLGPHIARILVGPGHRRLVPAAAISGAVLLMVADAVARSIAAPIELPVGVVTAIVGAPLFLWLLSRSPDGGRR